MADELTSINNQIAKGRIGRHETFTPRYGWLKKGYDAVIEDNSIFTKPSSIEALGVGKNMVNSIKFWCGAFNLIEQDKSREIAPTKFGHELLDSKEGWDPFLEDPASLWVLHWQLFLPPFDALSWPVAFNRCNLWSFDTNDLAKIIQSFLKAYPRLSKTSPNTIFRDASCVIRMYSEDDNKEHETMSVFSQLGLIYRSGEKNRFSFNSSYKTTLHPLIFAAACFSYASEYLSKDQKNVSLQRLAFDFNSPGVAYKLPETIVGQYLSEAAHLIEGFSLVTVLGNVQLHFEAPPQELFYRSLEQYYAGVK